MRRILPYLLLLPTAAFSILWWRADQERRAALVRVAQLETALAKPQPSAPNVEENTAEPESSRAAAPPRIIRLPTGMDPSQYLKTIDELREQLTQAGRDLSTAREEASRAGVKAAADAAELTKLQVQLAEVHDDLQAARRMGDALQAELRSKSDRLVKAETSEKLNMERLARADSASAKVADASKEIEDLNRRREAYMTTLLRRFREATDLYRNFSLNAQTGETPAGGLQAGDLSRIQSTMQQAEDDMRQLQALNARAAQLARGK